MCEDAACQSGQSQADFAEVGRCSAVVSPELPPAPLTFGFKPASTPSWTAKTSLKCPCLGLIRQRWLRQVELLHMVRGSGPSCSAEVSQNIQIILPLWEGEKKNKVNNEWTSFFFFWLYFLLLYFFFINIISLLIARYFFCNIANVLNVGLI